jgi:hypothetical protein
MPHVNQHGNMTGFSAEQTSNKNKPNTSITRRVETHGRASLRATGRVSIRANDATHTTIHPQTKIHIIIHRRF